MSIIAPDPLQSPPLPSKRGRPLLAWFVIVAAVGFEIGFQPLMERVSQKYATREQRSNERAYLSELQLQGREIVGMVHSIGLAPSGFESQIKDGLTSGPYESRLRFIVLTGELNGPSAALEQLSLMRENEWNQRAPTPQEEELAKLLDKMYRAEEERFIAAVVGGSVVQAAQRFPHGENEPEGIASVLSEDERRELREKLGWFGDLALAPAQDSDPAARAAVLAPARKIALTSLFIAFAVFFLAITGFFLLTTGALLLFTRLLRPRFQAGSRDGGIYAETFALWMVVYMALGFGGRYIPVGNARLLLAAGIGLSSLIVLGWPVLRGVSWRRVRQDIGWWKPGPALLEALWGIGCYIASMPLLLVGVALSLGLLSLYKRFVGEDPFGVPVRPTHPITEMLLHSGWWEKLQIFLLAAVCAPIIEETMFRGVLYRHLRELGTRWPRVLSVLFSSFAASFVFAVIHPQGFSGVPVLMVLALGFAMARELRGSLVGAMAAHGLNNALVTLLTLSMK